MEIKETIEAKTETIIGYKCSRCGREVYEFDIMEFQEFHHIDFVGGYGSVFGDGNRVRCDICQHCLKDIIVGFYEPDWD